MNRVNMLLLAAQYADNFTPKMLGGEISEWVKNENFFVFPYASPSYRQHVKRLRGHQYLERVDVFYAALTSIN
jgi:hypothetical protein